MENLVIDGKKYNYPTWIEKYTNKKIKFYMLELPGGWYLDFFETIAKERPDVLKTIEKKLSNELDKEEKIFPYPDLIFRAFELVEPFAVKVVFIGQDPYPERSSCGIPHATGIAFSAPINVSKPASVINIHKNLVKFGHIKEIPKYGNFERWCHQGCLMINTSLTVTEHDINCHQDIWKDFTDMLIYQISKKLKNIIFVLWGAQAQKKTRLIDPEMENGHEILITSHPSPRSSNKKLGGYSAFDDFDHFGEINKLLVAKGKTEIDWNVYD